MATILRKNGIAASCAQLGDIEEQNHDEDRQEDIEDVDDNTVMMMTMATILLIICPKTFFYFSRSRIRVTPRFFEYKVGKHILYFRKI